MDHETEAAFVMAISLVLLAAKNYIRCRQHYVKNLKAIKEVRKMRKKTEEKVESTKKYVDNNDESKAWELTPAAKNLDETKIKHLV